MVKSFDDFWYSITEDDWNNIAENVNASLENMRKANEIPETLLGNQIGISSVIISKEILNRYHEWLSTQL